ncbi:MAG: hypothetical protein IPM47_11985 [Sphingobacteriales bacterium]|nr:MAG: hypothetical protein IPM47_11985 [Sphingobacteriales bacterium]
MREQMPLILLALLLLSTSIFVVQKWHVLSWFETGVHNSIIPILTPPSNQKPTDSTTKPADADTQAQDLERRSKTTYQSRSGKTEDRIKNIQKDLELLPNSGLSSEKQEKIKERLNEFLKVVINDKDVRNNKNCQQSRANLNMANKSAVLSQDQENFLKEGSS